MLTLSRAGGVAVALAICTVGFFVAKHTYDEHVVKDALRAQQTAEYKAVDDTLSDRLATVRASFDSATRADRADSVHLAAIAPHITLTSPTVITVDTSQRIPNWSNLGSSPPPLVVSVPPEVTDLIQTQARRITELEGKLQLAMRGWQLADSAMANLQREVQTLEPPPHHWYSRVSCGPGYAAIVARASGRFADGPGVGCTIRF